MEGTVTISIHQYEHYKECEKLAGEIPTVILSITRSSLFGHDTERTNHANLDSAMKALYDKRKKELELMVSDRRNELSELDSQIVNAQKVFNSQTKDHENILVSLLAYNNIPNWIKRIFK